MRLVTLSRAPLAGGGGSNDGDGRGAALARAAVWLAGLRAAAAELFALPPWASADASAAAVTAGAAATARVGFKWACDGDFVTIDSPADLEACLAWHRSALAAGGEPVPRLMVTVISPVRKLVQMTDEHFVVHDFGSGVTKYLPLELAGWPPAHSTDAVYGPRPARPLHTLFEANLDGVEADMIDACAEDADAGLAMAGGVDVDACEFGYVPLGAFSMSDSEDGSDVDAASDAGANDSDADAAVDDVHDGEDDEDEDDCDGAHEMDVDVDAAAAFEREVRSAITALIDSLAELRKAFDLAPVPAIVVTSATGSVILHETEPVHAMPVVVRDAVRRSERRDAGKLDVPRIVIEEFIEADPRFGTSAAASDPWGSAGGSLDASVPQSASDRSFDDDFAVDDFVVVDGGDGI
ncbi:hypothetical protein HK105_205352 [Polyrhizophydium stewartii]|uniref:Uncharacterized protein n=1 Tax=Polyrhizophydium stewartii TaxID=2732419 RepID=A0ABR4N6B5_9FUNG